MLVDVGPVTANCDEETEIPVMFNCDEPVLVMTRFCAELVVFCVTEPNANEFAETFPCAVA
jgi:hypothetical protein